MEVGERIGLVVVVVVVAMVVVAVAMVVVVVAMVVVVDKVQKVIDMVVDKYFHRLDFEVEFDYVIDP